MASPNGKRDNYPEGYRWNLAEKFRDRANYAANILRSFTVALSGASTYFLVDKFYDDFGLHLVSVVLFVTAIAVTVWSWDIQKTKSAERLTVLRDEGYKSYLNLEQSYQESIWRKNYIFDRVAYASLGSGILIELAIVLFRIGK